MPPKEIVLDPEPGLCFFHNPPSFLKDLERDQKVHSWVPGKCLSWDPKKGATCQAFDNSNPLFIWENSETCSRLKADEVLNIGEEILKENVLDLLQLTVLHDSTILNVLRKRYMDDYIYTNIGAITIALNPFNFKIPWYTDDNMPKYLAEGDRIEENIPHSWATAHNTYWEMRNATYEPYNQCILVSGESGAGKTEASKIVMKYLACLSCREGTDAQKKAGLEVGTKINITSPPLEAFGNAKTSRNDNSSRFGKWMQVKFDSSGFLVGADITKYLLEKSRIVTASKGERVYHSFYLMCRNKDKAKWHVGDDKSYISTSAGSVSENKDFDTQEEFDEVNDSLSQLHVSPETVDAMWRTVAGVLLAENVLFEPDGEGSKIAAKSDKDIENCVDNWRVDKATFRRELSVTTLHIPGTGDVDKKLTQVAAMDARSALTKTLYDCLFQWLIDTCNLTLDTSAGDGRWIGLLDIFGFEDFPVNSFEQQCINLANESLQGHYNSYIFERDMDECRAEGIDVASVVFPDNKPCLNMISGKGGIFAILDEECSLGKGSDQGFLDKVVDKFGKAKEYEPFFLKKQLAKSSYIIHHYAGSVSYEVAGFLDKNRDTLKPAFRLLMRASSDPFIKEILAAPVEDAKKKTVGGFFKEQVHALMDKINSTNPHWIRCVKPHPAKKPLNFHGVQTMGQLASSGVLGTVRIRKAGYPVRIPFEPFYQSYRILGISGGTPLDPSNLTECAHKILQCAGIETKMGQVGKTRVFLKSESYVKLEQEKKKALARYGEIVQAWARGYFAFGTLKEKVFEQNAEVITRLRAQITEQLKEKREKEAAEREAREKAEREEREKRAKEEAELRERVADALGHIFEDADTGGKDIQEAEDREWRRMLEEFEERKAQVELEVKEREERVRREAEERKLAEERRIQKAVLDMQRTVRGFIERGRLLRDLIERQRAQTEFDIDASIFRQHQRMLALDRRRVEMERNCIMLRRARAAENEREALFRDAAERRARQKEEVAYRKAQRHRAEEEQMEEITEAAVEEALRLRDERKRIGEEEAAIRQAENVARRQYQQGLADKAHRYRQQRARESEEYLERRLQTEELTRQVFAEQVQRQAVQKRALGEKRESFARGRNAWAQREGWEMEREAQVAADWAAAQTASLKRSLSPRAGSRSATRSAAAAAAVERRLAAEFGVDPTSIMGSPGYVPYQVDRFGGSR